MYIYISADLALKTQETIGPKTNSRTVAMLHPDMSQTSPDQGRIEKASRETQRDVWLPTKNLNNIQLKNHEFYPSIASGIGNPLREEEALYVKNMYSKTVVPAADAPVDQFGAITVPEDSQLLLVLQV